MRTLVVYDDETSDTQSQLDRAITVVVGPQCEQAGLPRTPSRGDGFIEVLNVSLGVGIAATLLIRLYLVTTLNINWDEFFYLSRVFQLENQQLASPLQNFHVHLFRWLTWLPGTEIDQIIAARFAVAVVGIGTAILVFSLSRRYFGTPAALATVFVYVTFSQSVMHGFSFRADPLCAWFCFLAFYLLARWSMSAAVTIPAGAAFALSLLISIKSVFYAFPLLVALVWLDHRPPGRYLRSLVITRLACFGVSTLVVGSILFFWHESMIEVASQTHSQTAPGGQLQHWVGKMFFDAQFFPRLREFRRSISENVIVWLFIAWSFALLVRSRPLVGSKRADCAAARKRQLAMALATPFLAIPFYRNAFPYFYAFLLPASCLVLAAGFAELLSRAHRSSVQRTITCLLLSGVALTGAFELRKHLNSEQIAQRAHLEAIHQMFTAPVPYLDRCSMVSSFPKQGFFMSTWGLEKYRRQDQPIMRELIIQYQPEFLLVNSPVLTINDSKFFGERKHPYFLLDEDYQTLHDHFVQHWGAIFVPGQRFDHDAISRGAFEFDILTEGTYTLESLVDVQIDDVLVRSDETIRLAAGRHRIRIASDPASSDLSQPFTLRWGDHLFRPTAAPPTQPIFTDL